jgi:hypothetical protein
MAPPPIAASPTTVETAQVPALTARNAAATGAGGDALASPTSPLSPASAWVARWLFIVAAAAPAGCGPAVDPLMLLGSAADSVPCPVRSSGFVLPPLSWKIGTRDSSIRCAHPAGRRRARHFKALKCGVKCAMTTHPPNTEVTRNRERWSGQHFQLRRVRI